MLRETLKNKKHKALVEIVQDILRELTLEGFTSAEFLEAIAECLHNENYSTTVVNCIEEAATAIRQSENQ